MGARPPLRRTSSVAKGTQKWKLGPVIVSRCGLWKLQPGGGAFLKGEVTSGGSNKVLTGGVDGGDAKLEACF